MPFVWVLLISLRARWARASRVLVAGALSGWLPVAMAATYTFPGALPAACTSTGSGVYTCASWTTGLADTVNFTGATTINVTGLINFQGSQVNAGGSASNLTINLASTATLSASSGAKINANISGGNVLTAGAVTIGGSITTTTGYITIGGGSTVSGALTSTSGAVTLSSGSSGSPTTVASISTGGTVTLNSYPKVLGTTTGYLVSAASYPWFGGNVTATSSYVSFGDHATVNGNISAASYVYTGLYSTINGSITSGSLQVDLAGYTTVSGAITANGTYVNFGLYSSAGGAVSAQTYVDLGYGGSVTGAVTAQSWYINGDSLTVTGNMSAGTYIDVHSNGTFGGSMTAGSYVNFVSYNTITGNITANGGPVYIYDHDTITGDVVSATSFVNVGTATSVSGSVTAATTSIIGLSSSVGVCLRSTTSQLVTMYSPTLIAGACCGTVGTCTKTCLIGSPTPANCQSLHHLVLQHSTGTGLTCTPSTMTIVACANSGCTTLYTGGLTGTLTATGSGMTTNFPSGSTFTIAAGSSSTTLSFQTVTPGSVTMGTSSLSTSASSSTTCNFGSPSCTFTAADSGFLVSVPNHAAGTSQTATITAVKKSLTSTTCTPAFASVTKSVTLTCGYSNPSTGTKPLVVGVLGLNASGLATSACDATGQPVSLTFNASGAASATLSYADVGQMTLSAAYTGSGTTAGLSMSGSGSFIVAPSSFAFSSITTGPIKAGRSFSATVSALNALGVVTPNFGRETSAEGVRLSWTKAQPTGTGASSGTFSGSGVSSTLTGFSSGAVTASDLSWTEVGTGDLTATLGSGSYLGSGLTATGTTGTLGAVGTFIPDHFDVTVSQGCSSLFTYSGQPFTVGITARNYAGGTTVNYNGTATTTPTLAQVTTLSAATNASLGSFTSSPVALTSFVSGVASAASGTFTFTNKLTAPASVQVRATDTNAVSSATGTEGSVTLRSGRLRFTNAFGSEKSALTMPVQAQYWTGKSWVLNDQDSCTVVPVAAVALGNYLDASGQSTSTWSTSVTASSGSTAFSVASGNANMVLAKPTATNGKVPTGTVDVGINLGSTAADSSCLSTPRPATTGAALSWLRAQFGSSNGCSGAVDYSHDPSARATFGVYSPELKRIVNVNEVQ